MNASGTRVFALLGNPVRHSLSPFIMNRAFDAAGIDARYLALPVPAGGLEAAVTGLGLLDCGGANVTYPCKQPATGCVEVVAGDAGRIGAVNTLAWLDGVVTGHNTDAPGVAMALEQLGGVSPAGKEVHVFGAGASARAAAWGVLAAGARAVTLGTRSPERAGAALDGLRSWFRSPVDCVPVDDRIAVEVADIVINATPLGMGDGGSPLPDESWIHEGQVCFDFVYHPRHTPFLEAARRRGARALDGIALLVCQAALSFEIWTGTAFDVDAMVAAVDAHTGETA